MDLENNTLIFKEFPLGPLTEYRNQARFDWRRLKLFFEDEEDLRQKMIVWKTLEKDPLFKRSILETTTDEMKRTTALRLRKYIDYKFVPTDVPYRKMIRLFQITNEALASTFPDVSIKYALGVVLYSHTIITLGTDKHRHFAYASDKMLGCIALTEVSHGSDTKQMRTTSTFDENSQEFIIDTPDFRAAKFFPGNLGKQCTHGLVFAQLYTKGKCYGLHPFIVPIRDPTTLLPYPGITVGDVGEKFGLNGIDNGFIIFKQYRIPKNNLLNKFGDITSKGIYVTQFSNVALLRKMVLENLSLGRMGIMQECSNNLISVVTIAVRYAAVRKQFAKNGKNTDEQSIIEYPLHQWRLFPYMAAAAVLKIFITSFTETYLDVLEKTVNSNGLENLNVMVSEIHAIVCGGKVLFSTVCRDAIQECREACGGFGYLKAARFAEIKGTQEATLTYEGDNNVLMQQTSNWLLKQFHALTRGQKLSSPFESCSFFQDHTKISSLRCQASRLLDVQSEEFIMTSFQWLILYLIQETDRKSEEILKAGYDRSTARNESQVYKAAVLCRAFSEFTVLRYYWDKVKKAESNFGAILNHLGILYGLTCLEKHVSYFYEGGYAEGAAFSKIIKNAIIDLCKKLKPDALGTVDALAPPDYVLHSVLGNSDGRIYENLENLINGTPGAMDTEPWWHRFSSWWREIAYNDSSLSRANVYSKL